MAVSADHDRWEATCISRVVIHDDEVLGKRLEELSLRSAGVNLLLQRT